ncbi:putative deoxyribonuclease YcfH [bacterium BMS3Abin02]|nr:putative deoxyribonuclease YcfH [bacterium BMS3Abin02]
MYVDAHTHMDKYTDEELVGVLETIERQRILTFGVSIDVPSFVRTEKIATRSEFVVPSFGVHPWEAPGYANAIDDLDGCVERSPMIGEIGLDYRFVEDERLYPAQRQVFERLLDLARDQDKIVSVHCTGAERDTADHLARSGIDRGIIHWYSGPLDILGQLIETGLMFSVGVEVLRSDHIRDVARAIPADRLLTETDNPGGLRWLTGETGYPALIGDILDELSDVRGVIRNELLATVRNNMTRLIENDAHLRPWLAKLDA